MIACYSACFVQLKVISLCCLSMLCTVAMTFTKHIAVIDHVLPLLHHVLPLLHRI